jgi:hypothetical protein
MFEGNLCPVVYIISSILKSVTCVYILQVKQAYLSINESIHSIRFWYCGNQLCKHIFMIHIIGGYYDKISSRNRHEDDLCCTDIEKTLATSALSPKND